MYGSTRSPVLPEKWQGTNILTGGHFAYMAVHKPIPSRTTIGGVKVSIMYKNQPRVCFKCQKPGHLARKCELHSYTKSTTTAKPVTPTSMVRARMARGRTAATIEMRRVARMAEAKRRMTIVMTENL